MRTRTGAAGAAGAAGAVLLTIASAGFLAAAAPSARAIDAPTVQFHAPAMRGALDTVPAYVETQADSGAAVFARVCVECHEKVDVNGPDFRSQWSGQSVFALFERIRTSMPDDNPGSLPREDYLNVVAYLLKLNGIPASEVPMASDSTLLSAAILSLPPVGNN